MENRRAYHRLLLLNFAAAFYNLAAQWMIQILVIENFGPIRSLVGVYIPAAIPLIAAVYMFRQQPRGIGRGMLKSGVAIQIGIWSIITLFQPKHMPIFFMWFELFLVFIYALMAWHTLVKSREAMINFYEDRKYIRAG